MNSCRKESDISRYANVVEDLLDLIGQWGFKGRMDHLIVTGWFLAQMVQTVWEWRPHLWISGKHGSGKSLLTQLFEKMGGALVRRYEGQGSSEAGIRQDMQDAAVMVIIDEFEQSKHRDRILEVGRSASRGGVISKGSSNHKNVKFRINHMFMFCSIEIGLHRAAENTRFIVVETQKDHRRNPILPGNDVLENLRVKIFAYAIWASLKARALISQLELMPGIDRRFMESIAVPFAMLAVSHDSPVEKLNALICDYFGDWQKDQADALQEDEDKLLEDIMTANIRLPLTQMDKDTGTERTIYGDRTASQLITDSITCPEYHTVLETNGIKIRPEGLFFHPTKIRRQLLQNTDWAELSIREILLRVPGASKKRDRIAGAQLRGVFIPSESLAGFLAQTVPAAQPVPW